MRLCRVVPWAAGAVLRVFLTGLLAWTYPPLAHAANVMLAWDLSPDPTVAGYRIYYGSASRNYTNMVSAGASTSATVSNLLQGTTYYFAATAFNLAGLESDYSVEAAYAVPGAVSNAPPTLDPIADRTMNENGGPVTVSLSGITSGSSSENQTLTVSAFSSSPSVIPNPTVSYTSPNTTGSLSFAPAPNAYGLATITVMVDDGGAVSNTLIRSFQATVNPFNVAPTLDPIADLNVGTNAGPQTISLSGISSGASNEFQTLVLTTASSNPGLVPAPVVDYLSPNTNGVLTVTPVPGASGTATLSVSVSDGQPTNSTFSRSFNVTVNSGLALPVLTNAIAAPNTLFRYALASPWGNNHRCTFTLDPSAPAGAKITTKKNVTALIWTPTIDYASTTNVIAIHVADSTDPTLATNEAVVVAVMDYLTVIPGSTSVQAGTSASMPLTVNSSGGITNLTFALAWPTNRFTSPSLRATSPSSIAATLQVQDTNLLIGISALKGQSITGSNLVANLNFQSLTNQSSAFVYLPVSGIIGQRASGDSYQNCVPQIGQVAVVADVPLLQATVSGPGNRNLVLYGRVGVTYQLQYSTADFRSVNWLSTTLYTQTNVSQVLPVPNSSPQIFYRLQAQ